MNSNVTSLATVLLKISNRTLDGFWSDVSGHSWFGGVNRSYVGV